MENDKILKWLKKAPETRLAIVCRNVDEAVHLCEIINSYLSSSLDNTSFIEYARCGFAYLRITCQLLDGHFDYGIGSSVETMNFMRANPVEFPQFIQEISEDSGIFLSAFLY